MFDQTHIKQLLIQAAEQAWYACPHQTCLIRSCPENEENITHQTREQKKKFLIEHLMTFKFIKHDQTRLSTIKHNKTAPNKVSKQ